MTQSDPAGLPDPVVSPDAYDEEYYRRACAGSEEWSGSHGHRVADIYPGMLARAGFTAGEVVVDLGTGRGELVAVAASRGAARAVGIDYSPSAVELARRTLEAHGVAESAEVRLGDSRGVPIEDASADLVTLIDVVEHLSPPELAATLGEAYRILRPGGRIFAHTMPNRALYEVTYRLHRRIMGLLGRDWPEDPRNDYERAMHVNEQTRRSLQEAIRDAGFDPVRVEFGQMVHTAFLPEGRHARVYERLAVIPGTRALFAANLFATGWKPSPA